MAAHTSFGAFSGEPTEWEDYVERLENYFKRMTLSQKQRRKQCSSVSVEQQLTS